MYNKDGVSDVIGALLQVLNNRYKLKYNSTDPLALTRNKAENPITIQEAIMKKDNVFYPTSDILETISEIDNLPQFIFKKQNTIFAKILRKLS